MQNSPSFYIITVTELQTLFKTSLNVYVERNKLTTMIMIRGYNHEMLVCSKCVPTKAFWHFLH